MFSNSAYSRSTHAYTDVHTRSHMTIKYSCVIVLITMDIPWRRQFFVTQDFLLTVDCWQVFYLRYKYNSKSINFLPLFKNNFNSIDNANERLDDRKVNASSLAFLHVNISLFEEKKKKKKTEIEQGRTRENDGLIKQSR